MDRQGLGCVVPVISLQKLKNFLVQPKFRSLSQHGPGSSGDEGRSGGLDASQMHMYGNRTGGSSTSPPVSTSNSALLVVPQPINAATKPPSLTATNCTGRKYQCKMCPQIFMHKSAMQHHSREIHRGEIKPHQCQQCLKSFSSNHQLTQHIRIHTGEKPYKCSYCDRRFKQLSHVQQHTRLHTGERPYKCHLTNCGRAFIQLSNLQQHLRNHDNQMERAKNRPYLCNICGKGFASESSLRTHRSKQHAALIGGANSQSCPVCHKICLNGDALMEHMRTTHKDPNASGTPSKRRTTSHPCPICAKTYVNEGSLRKHLASHPESASTSSQLRMWPCTVCQSVFSHETGLLHHMESMRMEPKHQFAAQYILSRAAAEKREKAASIGIPSMSSSTLNITSESTSPSNTSSMDYQEQVASTSSHQSTIPSASCSHSLQLTGEETQHQFTTQYVLSHTASAEKTEKTTAVGMPSISGSTINVASDSTSPSNTSSVDYQDPIASTSSHQSIISSASCSHSLQLPSQGTQ